MSQPLHTPPTGAGDLTITALTGMPSIAPGDDLAQALISALEQGGLAPRDHDILAVTQKIVSKAENRYVDLSTVEPSARAEELAEVVGKDARLVEVILSQALDVVRAKPGVLIVETPQGLIMANAGIDQSNLAADAGETTVLLLPEDSDRSAKDLRDRLNAHFSCRMGIIITDSIGRPWRLGTIGFTIGCAGVPALIDQRGQSDLTGRLLETTETGFADAVAAAAVLVMGEAAEGRPAALVRGLGPLETHTSATSTSARALCRPKDEDLFR